MKKFFQEFKEFAMRGNVLDMAIGVVIGSAFSKITTSLVNDVFMPLIGLLIGGIDLGQLNLTLKAAVMDGDTVVKEPVTLGLGTFLSTSFWWPSSSSWWSRPSTSSMPLARRTRSLNRRSRRRPPRRSFSPRSATC